MGHGPQYFGPKKSGPFWPSPKLARPLAAQPIWDGPARLPGLLKPKSTLVATDKYPVIRRKKESWKLELDKLNLLNEGRIDLSQLHADVLVSYVNNLSQHAGGFLHQGIALQVANHPDGRVRQLPISVNAGLIPMFQSWASHGGIPFHLVNLSAIVNFVFGQQLPNVLAVVGDFAAAGVAVCAANVDDVVADVVVGAAVVEADVPADVLELSDDAPKSTDDEDSRKRGGGSEEAGPSKKSVDLGCC
ncbi:hypothetical protein OROMI_027077 [Orobanche minor]